MATNIKRKENIEKLASEIVESWDMDMLIGFATDHVTEDFTKLTDEEFEEEWNNFYDICVHEHGTKGGICTDCGKEV